MIGPEGVAAMTLAVLPAAVNGRLALLRAALDVADTVTPDPKLYADYPTLEDGGPADRTKYPVVEIVTLSDGPWILTGPGEADGGGDVYTVEYQMEIHVSTWLAGKNAKRDAVRDLRRYLRVLREAVMVLGDAGDPDVVFVLVNGSSRMDSPVVSGAECQASGHIALTVRVNEGLDITEGPQFNTYTLDSFAVDLLP